MGFGIWGFVNELKACGSLPDIRCHVFCDLGFGVWDLGFGIRSLGFGIWDLGFVNDLKTFPLHFAAREICVGSFPFVFGIWDLRFGTWDLGFGAPKT